MIMLWNSDAMHHKEGLSTSDAYSSKKFGPKFHHVERLGSCALYRVIMSTGVLWWGVVTETGIDDTIYVSGSKYIAMRY